MKRDRIKALLLHTTQGDSGTLHRESQFVVRYSDEALARPDLAISLTMPPRPEGYSTNRLPPVLAMNLPEGFLLNRVVDLYRKTLDVNDEMNLLAITSTPAAGRAWVSPVGGAAASMGDPISLRDILAYRGAEGLFNELLEEYGTPSISGVQPKVVVPERSQTGTVVREKSSVESPDLIVKAAGPEYPGLPENEFICMSIAKHVGLATPDFWLSDDRRLFVIRRFDIGPNGYLGFEDLAVLTGRHPSRKYEGSYGDVARAIGDFVAPRHRAASLESLFRLIVLCCLLRNGDAHLKNFGVLYADPVSAENDAHLAPVYDLVNTTMYLKKDVLALSMAGSKSWPTRSALADFARTFCHIVNPGQVIDDLIEKAMAYRHADAQSEVWKRIRHELKLGVDTIRSDRASRARRSLHA
ncbi:MAG: type II toxin-antitoxin system HipA family toxin [Burkholderiales bacterium]|nr:type II toxin-antitoxin system HipA family toxin [Burkholderiales bacterium]